MNNIEVNLLDYTSKVVAKKVAGKSRKSKESFDLFKKIGNALQHESILEHVVFNFEINNSSRLELLEHTRHRIASYTVQSTRYVLDYFTNEEITERINSISIFNKEKKFNLLYDFFVYPYFDLNKDEYYKRIWIESMIDKLYKIRDLKEKGYTNDFIKYILEESLRTELVFTINLRSLRNFLNLRLDDNAHFEIRYIAKLIKDKVKNTEYKELV